MQHKRTLPKLELAWKEGQHSHWSSIMMLASIIATQSVSEDIELLQHYVLYNFKNHIYYHRYEIIPLSVSRNFHYLRKIPQNHVYKIKNI